MDPQVCWRVFSSASNVRRQVFLGRPLLRFPSGVQCRAVRVMLSCSRRMTCPIHLHRLRMVMFSMLCWLQRASRSWLEMVWGQKMRRILLRLFVWKVESLLRSLSAILHESSIQSRTVRWIVRSSGTVWAWSWYCTVMRRFLMSLPAPPSCLSVLPRYVNSSVVVRSSPFTVTPPLPVLKRRMRKEESCALG